MRRTSSKRAILRRRHSLFEMLEARRLLSASGIESIDGTGNNVANPNWGSAGTDLIRLTAAAYADGVDSPNLSGDQSARAISNILNSQAVSATDDTDIATIDANSLSDFGYAFGQFMDHDLDNTPDGGASFPIAVGAGDPIQAAALDFTRSITDPSTGTSTANPAQQITTVTSYFDLSQVYGSSQTVSDALRTMHGGLMKTSPGNMLPYDNTKYFTTAQIAALNMANDSQAAPESDLFATGDVRGNENLELTTLQTLFVRNHNKIAGQLQKDHPSWTDEQLYQEARKLNIAEYQQIIYNEWIPAVLGASALPGYSGYKSNVNATIANEFSTVAFRFGHSLLSADIERHTNSGEEIPDATGDSDITLAEDFFDPYLLGATPTVDPLTGHTSSDIGPILKAEADGVSQATDLMAVNDVRNLLFGNGVFGGDDLIARDVQRGRDNGIADYNTLRVEMGLPAVTSFSQITSNVKVQKELAAAYPGGVNTIDAFEGGMAEDHVKGSDVGPLFQAIMVNQFTRLRDGDRFFYLNESFNAEEKSILGQAGSLTRVIEANTNITNLQPDAFVFAASISGTIGVQPPPAGKNAPPAPPPPNLAGWMVQLLNEDGVVVATTKPDGQGRYSFNQFSGPSSDPTVASGVSSVGTYRVVLVPPTGNAMRSGVVDISVGGMNVQGVNFELSQNGAKPPPAPPPPPAGSGLRQGMANSGGGSSSVLDSADVLDKLMRG